MWSAARLVRSASATLTGYTHESRMPDAVRMNAAYERADVKLSGGLDVEPRFDL